MGVGVHQGSVLSPLLFILLMGGSCASQWSVHRGFCVGVGVHQGSVLSPLLFILLMGGSCVSQWSVH